MIEKLYGKYLMECSNNSILEVVAFELFKEKICDKLSDMNSIVIDNGVDEQGVLYYSLWSNDGIQPMPWRNPISLCPTASWSRNMKTSNFCPGSTTNGSLS